MTDTDYYQCKYCDKEGADVVRYESGGDKGAMGMKIFHCKSSEYCKAWFQFDAIDGRLPDAKYHGGKMSDVAKKIKSRKT